MLVLVSFFAFHIDYDQKKPGEERAVMLCTG
jgi:hypothetical protein